MARPGARLQEVRRATGTARRIPGRCARWSKGRCLPVRKASWQ